jgi:hypothetical protein
MPRGMPFPPHGARHAGGCVVAGAFACRLLRAVCAMLRGAHYTTCCVVRAASERLQAVLSGCCTLHLRDDLVLGRKFRALVRVRDVHEIVDRRGPVCVRVSARVHARVC